MSKKNNNAIKGSLKLLYQRLNKGAANKKSSQECYYVR